MRTRVLAFVLAPALIASLAAAPASGWANGPNGDGYGTHDWVLEQAYKLVGSDAAWFDKTTALLATDDPDYLESDVDPYYTIEHVYRDQGKYGGAIHRITERYAKAVRYYEAGQYKSASKQIGLPVALLGGHPAAVPHELRRRGQGLVAPRLRAARGRPHRHAEDSSTWQCSDCTTADLIQRPHVRGRRGRVLAGQVPAALQRVLEGHVDAQHRR